jgi:hypothetical protein
MENFKELILRTNQSYARQYHGITDEEIEEMVILKNQIEKIKESSTIPTAGDFVVYTTKHGEYYGAARIDKIKFPEVSICQRPYIPWVWISQTRSVSEIMLSMSGGAFGGANISDLKFVGKAPADFYIWGRHGGCANGAISFPATVNVFEYSEQNIYGEYTTEYYRKQYINYSSDKSGNYKYFGPGIAFNTSYELENYIQKFKGVVFKDPCRGSANSIVVFLYREGGKLVSQEEFDKIDTEISYKLMNGSYVEVKIEYDDDEKVAIFYRTSNFGQSQSFEEYNNIRKAEIGPLDQNTEPFAFDKIKFKESLVK